MASKDLFGNEIHQKPRGETFHLSDGSAISELDLAEAEEKVQLEAMRTWFHTYFQNPVEETPWNSEEGGYQYIFGGPYEPQDEIDSRFEGIVPEEVRAILVEELEDQSYEWAGREREGDIDHDYDEYVLDAISIRSEHIARIGASIANIRMLIKTPVDSGQEQFFLRLLYASVITVLETYLSDTFVSSITNNPKALRNFVETFPRFQKESIKLSNIFKNSERLERRVKLMLLEEVLWHNLVPVRKMFIDTFDLDFSGIDLKDLLDAVKIRHDIVHRSGKDKDGNEHTITSEQIESVIKAGEAFVSSIDRQHDKLGTDDLSTTKI